MLHHLLNGGSAITGETTWAKWVKTHMDAEKPDHLSIVIKPLSMQWWFILPVPTPHRHINKKLTSLQIRHNVQSATWALSVHYPLHTFCMLFTCTRVRFFGETLRRNDRTTTQHGAVQRTPDVLNVRRHTHVVHGHRVRRRCSDGITYPTLGRPPIPPLKELPKAPNQWWWWPSDNPPPQIKIMGWCLHLHVM